jgi:hypothetical protein
MPIKCDVKYDIVIKEKLIDLTSRNHILIIKKIQLKTYEILKIMSLVFQIKIFHIIFSIKKNKYGL